jgi:hypothetical protein
VQQVASSNLAGQSRKCIDTIPSTRHPSAHQYPQAIPEIPAHNRYRRDRGNSSAQNAEEYRSRAAAAPESRTYPSEATEAAQRGKFSETYEPGVSNARITSDRSIPSSILVVQLARQVFDQRPYPTRHRIPASSGRHKDEQPAQPHPCEHTRRKWQHQRYAGIQFTRFANGYRQGSAIKGVAYQMGTVPSNGS